MNVKKNYSIIRKFLILSLLALASNQIFADSSDSISVSNIEFYSQKTIEWEVVNDSFEKNTKVLWEPFDAGIFWGQTAAGIGGLLVFGLLGTVVGFAVAPPHHSSFLYVPTQAIIGFLAGSWLGGAFAVYTFGAFKNGNGSFWVTVAFALFPALAILTGTSTGIIWGLFSQPLLGTIGYHMSSSTVYADPNRYGMKNNSEKVVQVALGKINF